MADLKYNISDLFREAFGINSPVFLPSEIFGITERANIDYSGMEYLDTSKASATSWMGTPIMFPATLKGGEYHKYKDSGELGTVRLDDLQLPAATLFSFRRAKNITRTNLLGSNGTVKEIYGFDDWVIDVRGICLDEPGNPAINQMDKIIEWENVADAVGITGELFNQLEIRAVCIKDFRKDGVQGTPGMLPFQMQLLSDEAIELILPS